MELKTPLIDEETYLRYKLEFARNPKFIITGKYNHFTPEIIRNYKKNVLLQINEVISFLKEKKIILLILIIIYLSSKIEVIQIFLSKNYLLKLVLDLTNFSEIIIKFLSIPFLFFWIFRFVGIVNLQEDIIRDHNVYQRVLKKHIIESFDYQNFLFKRKEYNDNVVFKIMWD